MSTAKLAERIETLQTWVEDHEQDHWDEPGERFEYAQQIMNLTLDISDEAHAVGCKKVGFVAEALDYETCFDDTQDFVQKLWNAFKKETA